VKPVEWMVGGMVLTVCGSIGATVGVHLWQGTELSEAGEKMFSDTLHVMLGMISTFVGLRLAAEGKVEKKIEKTNEET